MLMSIAFFYLLFLLYATLFCDSILACLCTYFLFLLYFCVILRFFFFLLACRCVFDILIVLSYYYFQIGVLSFFLHHLYHPLTGTVIRMLRFFDLMVINFENSASHKCLVQKFNSLSMARSEITKHHLLSFPIKVCFEKSSCKLVS